MVAAYRTIVAAFAVLAKAGMLTPEPPFRPVAQVTGADTAIESPRVAMIQDQSAWNDLWREHRQTFQINVPQNAPIDDSERPKVNFSTDVVLCLFGGQSKNVGGFELAQIGDLKDQVIVRIKPTLLPATGAELLQNPYMFLILPRTRRKMSVQLDQSALGGDGWRTLADLPPTKH